jgi:hypothetical protein
MKTRASYVPHIGSEGPGYKKYLTQWLYSSRISGDPEPSAGGKIDVVGERFIRSFQIH